MDPFKTLVIGTPPSRTYTGSAVGLLTAANNLSDVADAATAAENIGVGATDSPTFAGVTSTGDFTSTDATGAVILGTATEILSISVTAAGGGVITPKNGQALSVGSDTATTSFLALNAAAGRFKYLIARTAGVERWYIGANNTAESGSDAGTDFQIVGLTDAGAVTGTALFIKRSTLDVTIGSTTDSTTKDTGALVVEGGLGVEKAIVTGGAITTAAPAGGTAGAWKFGVAASVSPTSPNRTIELDIGGTIYYLHAKTTNN